MPLMPGAKWTPLAANWNKQPKLQRYDLILLHTMVGSLWGTDGYFRKDGYGGAESHFGVGFDGEILQWQDTGFKAEANGVANHRAISIETADIGTGFLRWNTNDGNAVPAWTAKQIEAIAQIIAWASRTHDIPTTLIPDSRPTRRGVGYHRLGVPGYLVAGGEVWSQARGKVCPGPRRIAQIPAVVARANDILDILKPKPNPGPIGDDYPLQLGSNGPNVTAMQVKLNRRFKSYSNLVEDGDFGPATDSVVREFQKRSGLLVDGIVGPATRQAMGL